MSENIREIILDTLLALDTGNGKSHLLIRDVLDKYDYLDFRDKAFYKRVTEGTITKRLTLDYVLNSYSKKPVEKCKPSIRAILRMSAYQILFMEKIPDNAVCDEAVKLCRKRSFEEFCPFVNGVLRNLCKNKSDALKFNDIEDETLRLSVRYSMPEWLVRMFKKEQKDAEAILKSFDDIRPTCVRIRDNSKREGLLKAWESKGINFKESSLIPGAFLIDSFEGAYSLPGFLEGDIIVQDESSMLVGLATGLKKGDDVTVIDVCAAPGGKSTHVADILFPKGRVLSFDVSDSKVSLINENAERLGLTNIETACGNATEFNSELEGVADVLICDVPCSGLGIMGRKSDIRYNISNESMKSICDLQKEIINNVWKYLKPGGVMIYSTCTIHKAENEKMVKYIIENLPFEADTLSGKIPESVLTSGDSHMIQLLPNVHGTDGFFIARLKRKQE